LTARRAGSVDDTLRTVLFLAAAALVAAFFLTRKSMLLISSNGDEKINVSIKDMSSGSGTKFLEAIENAKLNNATIPAS